MAFTRAFLEGLGVDASKIGAIIEEHTDTTNRILAELKEAKGNADKLTAVQKELDDLKKEDYKGKYESEKSEHEKLKTSIANEKAKSAKESALKAYFEGKNIKDGNLKIAMRGVSLDSIELDGDNIKDTKALDELVAGDFKALVTPDKGGKGAEKKAKVVDSGASLGKNDYDKDGNGNHDYSLGSALREMYEDE